jgi:bifunctional DNA-binding transcriptional regulator/antitoxin component of YhaV-PrlF toxin-antitoxin module
MKGIELKTKLTKVKSSLMWDFRFPIDKDDAEKLIDKDRRVICTINNELEFNCGFIPDGKGNYYINVNKEIRKQTGIEAGDQVSLTIIKDESKYGMPIPPTFEELLYQDPEGAAYFEALTPGKIRSLLYLIGKPKSEQKQLEKGLIILDYLKEANGILDHRGLNEAFKTNRFKS